MFMLLWDICLHCHNLLKCLLIFMSFLTFGILGCPLITAEIISGANDYISSYSALLIENFSCSGCQVNVFWNSQGKETTHMDRAEWMYKEHVVDIHCIVGLLLETSICILHLLLFLSFIILLWDKYYCHYLHKWMNRTWEVVFFLGPQNS